MIEPLGGKTIAAGKNGVDTHTLYPNGSNYQRYNPVGHSNNTIPHGHGHLMGNGPGMKGQGASIDVLGNIVPFGVRRKSETQICGTISLNHRYYQDAMDWAKQYLGVNWYE